MSKVLVVVDMQNDFITGSLGTSEATQIVENVVKKIEDYKKAGYPVFYTRDTHEANYLETEEGKNLPVEHCIKDTWGWQIEDRIAKVITDETPIFDKETFGSVALGQKIKSLFDKDKNLEVEVIGLCTDICVISNALLIKAFVPQIPVFVDKSCCAGVTIKSHLEALETMKMCHIHIK